MMIRRPRRVALIVATSLLVALSPLLTSMPAAAAAPPPFTAMSGTVEAENLNGSFTKVTDATATGGKAVILTGAAYVVTGMPVGTYTLTARVRSTLARVQFGLAGARIGEFDVAGGWRTISVPVYVGASGLVLGVLPVQPLYGYQPQPLYLDWLSIAPSSTRFTVAGTKIIDNGGRFFPRGVNRNGLETSPTGFWMSDWDFAWMYAWGANAVRLQLTEVFWLQSSCHFDPNYAALVDASVKSITDRGMMAILDLHSSMGAAWPCDSSTPAGDYRMADTKSIDFWQQVAARYKDNPLVAFDLYNEPNIGDNVWRNGGPVTFNSKTWTAVGMQALYDAVRSTGAANLTFISGTHWGHDLSSVMYQPINGYGIVYSSHQYNDYACGPIPPDDAQVVLPAAGRYPVSFNEFGTKCDGPDYNKNVIDYANANNIGFLAFAWNDNGPPAWSLLTDFNTHQPSPAGVPVRDALWATHGWTSYGGT